MSYSHLTMDQRKVIYRMRFQGYCDAEIARCIGCHRATIGRECKRNANVEGRYDPANAQTLANSRRRAHLRQPKTGHRRLMAYVAEQLQRTLRRLPAEKRHSLTLDNGREFARPIELERKLDLPIYFAHPYHSWERGTNENTNGLLRQYLPKSTDLAQVPPEQLRSIVHALKHRPRKCLDFQSPFEVFHAKPPG